MQTIQTCYRLPAIAGAIATLATASMYNITNYTDLPNIYFDDVGAVAVHHREWKLIIYQDLTDLSNSIDTLLNSLLSIESMIPRHNLDILFDQQVSHARQLFHRTELLLNSVGVVKEKQPKSRVKRGWFNFIGSISKTFFGTLNEEDAAYYNREIDNVITDNNRLAALIKNETYVLKSTLKDNASFKEHASQRINAIIESINNQKKHVANKIMVLENLIQYNMLLQMYAETLELAEDIILCAEKGQIHPSLVDHDELTNVIKQLAIKYGENQLPFPAEPRFIYDFIRVSGISITVLRSKRLCFEIRIPILEDGQYRAYHLIALPEITNNGLKMIQLPNNYILLNERTRNFMPTSYVELKECRKTIQTRICKRYVPLYSITVEDPCLRIGTKTLNDNPKNHCKFGIVRTLTPIWHQLYELNRWVGIISVPDYIRIDCPGSNQITVEINGVILLELSKGCVAHTLTVTLFSEDIIEIHRSELELALPETNITITTNISVVPIPEIRNAQIDPDELNTHLRNLDSIESEANLIEKRMRDLSATETRWTFIKYALVGITSVLMLYAIIKFKVHHILLGKPCINIYNNCFNSRCNNNVANRDLELPENYPTTEPGPSPKARRKEMKRKPKKHPSFSLPE